MITQLFPKRSLIHLNWVIHNDWSVVELGAIQKVLKEKKSFEYDSLHKQFAIQLQNIYDVKKELSIFLNLDIIYPEVSYNINHKAGQNWHKVMKMIKNCNDNLGLTPRLYYFKADGINLNLLPESTNNLSFLRSLLTKGRL